MAWQKKLGKKRLFTFHLHWMASFLKIARADSTCVSFPPPLFLSSPTFFLPPAQPIMATQPVEEANQQLWSVPLVIHGDNLTSVFFFPLWLGMRRLPGSWVLLSWLFYALSLSWALIRSLSGHGQTKCRTWEPGRWTWRWNCGLEASPFCCTRGIRTRD